MAISAQASEIQTVGRPVERSLSRSARKLFLLWTGFWWGGVGVCAFLFFFEVLDFVSSTKLSLYGISIWLNGWLVVFFATRSKSLSRMDLYHNCLVVWVLSYAMTNLLWEIPWVIFSPFIFTDLNTIDDVLAHTGYMRESILHMYWWMLASFGSVDLRTVNHDPTFYSFEIFAFANLATTLYFFHLNKKRSPYRYLVAVLGCCDVHILFRRGLRRLREHGGRGGGYTSRPGLDSVPVLLLPLDLWSSGLPPLAGGLATVPYEGCRAEVLRRSGD